MNDVRSITGAPIEPEDRKHSRRRFLELAGGTAVLGGVYGVGWFNKEGFAVPKGIRPPHKETPQTPDIVCVEGNAQTYGDITERAINELGGIEKFVKKGDKVFWLGKNSITWLR